MQETSCIQHSEINIVALWCFFLSIKAGVDTRKTAMSETRNIGRFRRQTGYQRLAQIQSGR